MAVVPAPRLETPRVPAPAAGTSAWRGALVAEALALVLVLACFHDTAASMIGVWARSDTFMHGFLIAPIAALLVFRMRSRLAAIPPVPSYAAIAPTLVAGAVWMLGTLANADVLAQFAFTAILVLTVPMILGWTVARAMAFPLAFLFFMVPFGEFMLGPLMEGTATFTVAALRLSGVPVYREGLMFVIPSGNWSVVEACSGVRYLIASLVVGTLYAYLNYRSLRRRLVFCAVSALLPIVANWLRAYFIVMLGHLSSNRLAVGVDHLIYGWVFFGIVIFGLFWVGSYWHESAATPSADTRTRGFADAGPLPGVVAGLASLAAFAVAVAAWPIAARALQPADDPTAPPALAIDALPGGWTTTRDAIADWTPRYVGATAEALRTFARDDARVGLYVAYYRAQGPGRKIISSENALVRSEEAQWSTRSTEYSPAGLPGVPAQVRESRLSRVGGTRLVAWQWYWVDGELTSSDTFARLRMLKERLGGRRDTAAAIIVWTRGDDLASARATLADFLRDAGPRAVAALDGSRELP